MKIVVKFGGSSLASAEQFKKVGKIIKKDEARKYVIPSAPGKRTPDDTKVTDLLYSCYGQAILEEDECEENFESLLAAIKKRYEEIISGLGLTLSLDDEFRTIGRILKWHNYGSLSGLRIYRCRRSHPV